MAQVKHVKAAKDYPDSGIKKGDMHYVWALFRRPTMRSLTRPTRSQLTSSDFKTQFYDMVDTTLPACSSDDALRDLATEVRELGQEQAAKVDELPENFQSGEQGERLNNRESELETWADEIESAADDLGAEGDFDKEGRSDGHETYAEALAAVIEDLEASAPDPE